MSSLALPAAARRLLLAGSVLVVACAATAGSASVAAKGTPPTRAAAVHSARVPRPVAVTLDPRTTAYLLLDLTSVVCAPLPSCVDSLPAAAALLARARAAGVLVVYSETPTAGSQILPQVAPKPGDPIVVAHADKFFDTTLDQTLRSHGIETLVVVGTAANGAVLYTTFEANLRGYTVVVARDGISADSRFILRYSTFQLVNEPGFSNPANVPLRAHAVTLSQSHLISFRGQT